MPSFLFIPLFFQKSIIKLNMDKVKGRYITRELALLRARAPDPPMVSHLDEVDDNAIVEGIRKELYARLLGLTPATAAATEVKKRRKAHVQPTPPGTLGSHPASLDTTTPLGTLGSKPTPLPTQTPSLQTSNAKPAPSTPIHTKQKRDGTLEEGKDNSGEKKKQEEEKEEKKVEEMCPDPHPTLQSRRQMTPKKKGHACPLCTEFYVDIAQHLQFTQPV